MLSSVAYDGLQRLVSAAEQPGQVYTYTYDLVGNRTGAWANGVAQGHWQYGAGDQVVGWQYDQAGNLLDDGTQQYRYDALNRLTGVTSNGAGYPQTTMQYNGDGVMVAQMQHGSLTRFTQDLVAPLSQVLRTSNGNANANTTYVYGLDRLASIRSGTWTWSVADALGSTRLTLDDAGRPQTTSSFDAWGQPTTGILPTPFGFTGEWQDTSTGLVNLRARWYQPQTGRFLGRDPFPGWNEQPYSLHPYQYGYNNPVLHTDPTGNNPFALCAPAIVAGPAGAGGCIAVVGGGLVLGYLAYEAGKNLQPLVEDLCRDLPGIGSEVYTEPMPAYKQPVLVPGPSRPNLPTPTPRRPREIGAPPSWPTREPAPTPGTQPVTPTPPQPTVTPTPDNKDIVYRVMGAHEHPGALTSGIWAKNPQRRVKPHRHVTHGNTEADNWISTTRNLLWALTYQTLDKQPIYIIDLKKVRSPYVDLTIPANTQGWHPRARNFALQSSEVLVDTHIPSDAIVGLVPYKE